jgi:hypothetical protein
VAWAHWPAPCLRGKIAAVCCRHVSPSRLTWLDRPKP